MKKKSISLALIFALILSLPIAVHANSNNSYFSTDTATQNKIVQHAKEVLKFMEPEKELYGLSNVDFSNLCLGERIPSYFYTNSGFIENNEVLYYPIMYNNTWIATSYVLPHPDGSLNVQITTDFADAYQDANVANKQISLVFDSTHTYLITDNQAIKVAASDEEDSNRAQLHESDLSSIPKTATLRKSIKIPTANTAEPLASFDNQKYLSVPLIKQASGSMECWAACIASIRGYYGTSTTIADVYKKAGKSRDQGANLNESNDTLKSYGFKTKVYNDTSLNWYQLRTEIYSYERPIFAACNGKNQIGHAVVVRGYYCYTNASGLGVIGYMDPDTGKYGASTVEKDYYFYYMPNGGGKHRMVGFLSVYK